MSDALRDKIHLLHGGDVETPEGFRNENIVYRDGEPYSITIAFEGTRARKKISDKGQFRLVEENGKLRLLDDGKDFLDDIKILKMYGHSPDTVTISVSMRDRILTPEEALGIMDSYEGMDPIKGITIHGDFGCPFDAYVDVVRAYHEKYPQYPIGVALPLPNDKGVRMLKEAGASDFKTSINDLKQFDDTMWASLEDAISVFGRGRITCGIHLNESMNDDILNPIIERMCSIGIMPDIKAMRSRTTGIMEASEERHYEALIKSKAAMERNGLSSEGYDTMCYGCRLCMAIPFKDF